MPIIHFFGRVIPDDVKLTLRGPGINLKNNTTGFDADLELLIEDSHVEVLINANRYTHDDFLHLFMQARDFASAAVDLAGFSTGTGMHVIIDRYCELGGPDKPILAHDPKLAKLCKSFSPNRPQDFTAMYHIATTTPGVRHALNDLISGLISPHQAPIACARAIEGLRGLIAPEGTPPDKAWPYMHEALRVTMNYLRPITDIVAREEF